MGTWRVDELVSLKTLVKLAKLRHRLADAEVKRKLARVAADRESRKVA